MELSGTVLSMKKLLLSYVKLGCRREVSRSRSNVMALCSRTDTANSWETYAVREVTKSVVSNFVSADRNGIEAASNRFEALVRTRLNLSRSGSFQWLIIGPPALKPDSKQALKRASRL